MLKGFRDFVLRGNVIELAVAVVIGAAFTAVVTAIVNAVINPAISALFSAETLAEALPVAIPTVSGGEAVMYFGAVIGAVLNFIIVAAVVYFALVAPMNYAKRRADDKAKSGAPESAPPPSEIELLAEIRDLLAQRNTTQ